MYPATGRTIGPQWWSQQRRRGCFEDDELGQLVTGDLPNYGLYFFSYRVNERPTLKDQPLVLPVYFATGSS